ncbi:MAG: undecaprenyl-diphosphate phosphatase [Coriobacteriia bacterium]
MTHLWAIILGAVQGFAEFLPVSSTAHLKLVPWVFGVRDPMLSSTAFDIALHAGSFVAIVVALWRDWLDLVISAFGGSPTSGEGDLSDDALRHTSFARKFIGFLLLTSIPGALFGVLLSDKIEWLSTPDIAGRVASGIDAATFHYAPLLLGVMLIVFGVALWASDRYVTQEEPLVKLNWWKALVIGVAQAAALIPGVSRSGSTMMAGRWVGLKREAVARYSFMAAMPIIGGAMVFGLKDVPLATLFSVDWVLGFFAAGVSSVLVMRWMLSYVRTHSFAIFMWYRIALGLFVIALFFMRG